MKYKIIHQIIARICKETHVFKLLKNEYNPDIVNQIMDLTYNGIDLVTFDSLTSHTSKLALKNLINEDYCNLSWYFNNILLNYLYDNILNYLHDQNLENIINNELRKKIYRKYNNVNNYIVSFKARNKNPYKLLIAAFDWDTTTNGFRYWHTQHRLYISFLSNLLK